MGRSIARATHGSRATSAVKVLPEPSPEDDERLARFQRESLAVAAPLPPNIVGHLRRRGPRETIAFSASSFWREKRSVCASRAAPATGGTHWSSPSRSPMGWPPPTKGKSSIGIEARQRPVDPEDGASRSSTSESRAACRPHRRSGDFGSDARGGDDPGRAFLIGTLAYLSPERRAGHTSTARSDVFSSALSSTRC